MTTNKTEPTPVRDIAMTRVPPTDLELMMYFDGELSEPRRSEVAAFVAGDAKSRTKLSGLEIGAAALRTHAEGLAGADHIADRVMSKVQAENGRTAHVLPFPTRAAQVGPAPVVQLPPAARRPANDNRRRIFAISAIAMAAAAGIAVWTQIGSFSGQTPQAPIAQTGAAMPGSNGKSAPGIATEIARSPSAAPTAAEVDAVGVERAEEEEHGVEVAAVDFGNRTGSIFYVPTGAVAAHQTTTTVVWVSDDAGDKP